MGKPKSLKVVALDPNLTRADIEALIADLGQLQRDEAAAISQADDIKTATDRLLATKRATIAASMEAKKAVVVAWATANREAICPAGSKTAKLATGEIAWRTAPKSVRITKTAEALAALKAAGLPEFIRVSEEIDKEAILKDEAKVAGIAGIKVAADEHLTIKPHQTAIDAVELVSKVPL